MQEVRKVVKLDHYYNFIVKYHDDLKSTLDKYTFTLETNSIVPNAQQAALIISNREHLKEMEKEYYRVEYYRMMELTDIEISDEFAEMFYSYFVKQIKAKVAIQ